MPTVSETEPASNSVQPTQNEVHGQDQLATKPDNVPDSSVQYEQPGTDLPESDSSHTTISSPKGCKQGLDELSQLLRDTRTLQDKRRHS